MYERLGFCDFLNIFYLHLIEIHFPPNQVDFSKVKKKI